MDSKLSLRLRMLRVCPTILTAAIAERLQNMPTTLSPLKLSAGNETLPVNPAYTLRLRAASILRRIVERPLSVLKLTKAYGRKKNRGSQPARPFEGTGAVIRRLVQALQQRGYVATCRKGRYATSRAKTLIQLALDEIK